MCVNLLEDVKSVKNLYDRMMLHYEYLKSNKEYFTISYCGFYDECQKLIFELGKHGFDLFFVDIENPKFNNYNKEYMISISNEGIGCKRLYDYKSLSYLYDETNVLFIDSKCNSKLLKFIDYDKVFEVDIDSTVDEDEKNINSNEEIDNMIEKLVKNISNSSINYNDDDKCIDEEEYDFSDEEDMFEIILDTEEISKQILNGLSRDLINEIKKYLSDDWRK